MRVLIRTELTLQSGMGHAVRCKALAWALASRGVDVVFLTTSDTLAAFVQPFHCQARWPRLVPIDVCVVDVKRPIPDIPDTPHIGIPGGTASKDTRMVRIDTPHATPDTCDLLVAPVAHWSPDTVSRLQENFGGRFLYGWDYVMLDNEVTSQAPIPYVEREDGPIVFCAGGSDPNGALTKMAEWCGSMVKVTDWIFLLPQHGTSRPLQYPWATCRPFSRTYLREAALVVTTFGITPYECLYWRTPTLCVAQSDENAEGQLWLRLRTNASVQEMGDMRAMAPQLLRDMVTQIWGSRDHRQQMFAASAGLLDGQGVARVAEAIIGLL